MSKDYTQDKKIREFTYPEDDDNDDTTTQNESTSTGNNEQLDEDALAGSIAQKVSNSLKPVIEKTKIDAAYFSQEIANGLISKLSHIDENSLANIIFDKLNDRVDDIKNEIIDSFDIDEDSLTEKVKGALNEITLSSQIDEDSLAEAVVSKLEEKIIDMKNDIIGSVDIGEDSLTGKVVERVKDALNEITPSSQIDEDALAEAVVSKLEESMSDMKNDIIGSLDIVEDSLARVIVNKLEPKIRAMINADQLATRVAERVHIPPVTDRIDYDSLATKVSNKIGISENEINIIKDHIKISKGYQESNTLDVKEIKSRLEKMSSATSSNWQQSRFIITIISTALIFFSALFLIGGYILNIYLDTNLTLSWWAFGMLCIAIAMTVLDMFYYDKYIKVADCMPIVRLGIISTILFVTFLLSVLSLFL